jgi:hypothetical protein
MAPSRDQPVDVGLNGSLLNAEVEVDSLAACHFLNQGGAVMKQVALENALGGIPASTPGPARPALRAATRSSAASHGRCLFFSWL